MDQKQLEKLMEKHDRIKFEAIGHIIEKTKQVEMKLELLLTAYINPPYNRLKLIKNVILSNSFFNFGAKINLFLYINKQEEWLKNQEKKKFIEQIRSILKTRNAFAHYYGTSEFEEKGDGSFIFDYKVESFEGEDFKIKKYKETIEEFNQKTEYIFNTLVSIIKSIPTKK